MSIDNYCIGNSEQPYQFLFVTGACRTGKTTFSRILGSMRNTEWIEEPYELSLFLKYIQVDQLDSFAKNWREQAFAALCKELANDAILLRNGNFRPGDLSTIWNYKEGKEIFHRLVNVNSRTQALEYIGENSSRFVIDVPEVVNTTNFIKKAYHNLNVIHFIRNPYDVAEAVFQKGWYSDVAIQHPEMNDLYRQYPDRKERRECFIPWWVEEGYEQYFVDAAEYERGIMYWISQTDARECEEVDFLIKYEDMVRNPQQVLQLFYELGLEPTTRTKMLCDELSETYISGDRKNIKLCKCYADKFIALKEKYKYE